MAGPRYTQAIDRLYAAGLQQKDIAALCRVGRSMVWKWYVDPGATPSAAAGERLMTLDGLIAAGQPVPASIPVAVFRGPEWATLTRKLRKRYSNREIATRLGVDPDTVRRWIGGGNVPNHEKLTALRRFAEAEFSKADG